MQLPHKKQGDQICVRSNLHGPMAPLVDPSIPELIAFFKCKPPEQHIYAHKEFFELSSGRRTRIKPTTQIMNQLRQESQLLVNFMHCTYNIRLQRNE